MCKKISSVDFFNIIIYFLTIILGILIAYTLINQYRLFNNDVTSVFSLRKYEQSHNIDKVLSVKYSNFNLNGLDNTNIVYKNISNN